MSIQFNDTTNYEGLVQLYEHEIGANYGDVSGNTARLKSFTADVNIAFDQFVNIAVNSSGNEQYDDPNHTDLGIITFNLVSGQQDYEVLVDEQNNKITGYYRMFVLSNGQYIPIRQRDAQTEDDTEGFWSGSGESGTPREFDLFGKSVFFNPTPNANVTAGAKAYVTREPSYFVYTDTTKEPGAPGTLHHYFFLKPAYEDKRRNKSLTNEDKNNLLAVEQEIRDHFGLKNRSQRNRFTAPQHNNR